MGHPEPAYSDADLVAELRRVASLMPEGALTKPQFQTRAEVSVSTFLRRFGSWRRALEVAGMPDRYSGRVVSEKMRTQWARTLSDHELLAELQRVAQAGPVTVSGLRKHSALSERVFVARFGSWPAAVAAAGLTLSPRGRYWTDDQLAAILLEVVQRYGRTPTAAELDRPPSVVTSSTYRRRFGNLQRARQTLGV